MEFKVGDIVRIVNEDICGKNRIGKICKKFLNYENIDRNLYKVDVGETYPYDIFEEELELYEEKEEEIEETKKLITLDELLERIEKLEKCVMGEQNTIEKRENEPIYEINERFAKILKKELERNAIILNEPKPSLLTEDERVILRNMNKDFKWIFRDIFNNLIIQKKKPKRVKHRNNEFILEGVYVSLYCYKHLFKFIKFEDAPYNIKELLKGVCEE